MVISLGGIGMQSKDEVVNVLLVGKPETGKSEFLKQYVDSNTIFLAEYNPTKAYNFRSKMATVDGSKLGLIIYDLSGVYWMGDTVIPFHSKPDVIAIFVDASVQSDKAEIETQLRKINDLRLDTTPVIFVMSKSDLDEQPTIKSRQEELNAIISELNSKYRLNINSSIQVISSKDKSGLDTLGDVFMNEIKKIAEQRNKNSKQSSLVKLIPPKKRSFMTRRPIVTAMLVGASLGLVLTVTGVFAPFGVAIIGAIGLGVVGLVIFGVAAGLIKNLTIRPTESPGCDRVRPSPSSGTQRTNKLSSQDKSNVASPFMRFFSGGKLKSLSHEDGVSNDETNEQTSTEPSQISRL